MSESGTPYLPRRGVGLFNLGGRIGERGAGGHERPLGVLLLPERLEAFALRDRVRDLLEGPGVLAIDPPLVSYRTLGRLPDTVLAGLAGGQARRMRFPGVPRAVLLFHPLQYPLARALISVHAGAQLWYAHWSAEADPTATGRRRARLADLDTMAAGRAEVRFDARPDDSTPARRSNEELWDRLERLGIESGRLGSQRADVIRAWSGGPGAAS